MKPMALSKVSLHKGDRTAVLLGMMHYAPPDFYQKAQKEVDAAHAAGYRVFREKTHYKYRYWPTKRERMLTRFKRELDEYVSTLHPPLVRQKDSVQYGKHRVADISMDHLARLFEKQGLSFDLPFDELCKDLCDLMETPEGYDILITQRNQVAVSQILKKCRKGNFLALYGEGHIRGMQRLLEEDGWSRAEWSILDFIPTTDD